MTEGVEAAGRGGADREEPEPVLPSRTGASGRHRRGHGHLHVGPRVGAELQACVAQREPVGLARDRLVGREERQDRVQRLVHHLALADRIDAEHEGVRREGAGPHPEHRPAERQVIEQRHPVGQHEGMVVGERGHARAEPDVTRARGRGGDEDFGGSDDLEAGGVMLADPRLVVAEAVEPLDQLQVAVEGRGRVLADGVERCEEDAEAHAIGGVHGRPF